MTPHPSLPVLGDELLDPESDRAQEWRREDRELVAAAAAGGGAEERAEAQRRVPFRVGERFLARGLGPRGEAGEVEVQERRGYHAEIGERRVTAADVGRIEEDAAEPRSSRAIRAGSRGR